MCSVPSLNKRKRNTPITRTNITSIVGEITHIVINIKYLTIPCSSCLTLIFFSSGRCFLCCPFCQSVHGLFRDGQLSSWLQFLRPSRLTRTMKHDSGQLPSWLQFLRPSWLTGTANHEAGLLFFLRPPGHWLLESETGQLHASIPLALLLPSPAVRRTFLRLRILHTFDFFAAQPILHMYFTERSGYTSKEATKEEYIHPPSHNEINCGRETVSNYLPH